MFKKYREGRKNHRIDLSKKECLEELFEAYYSPLCYFAKTIVGDCFNEDLVSSVFLKMCENKSKFDNIDKFTSYLYTAVKHASLDFLKTTKRREVREAYYVYGQESEPFEDIASIIQNEVWAETYRELKDLPLQCQKVVQLGYIEGLSNLEIAEVLGLSVQTVKNHKYRAIKLLKKKLVKFSSIVVYAFLLV